jgi:hypothetical protein
MSVDCRWTIAVPAAARDLAFHLISVHRDPLAIARPAAESSEHHIHEHERAARAHPLDDRAWDPEKLERILEEAEEMG